MYELKYNKEYVQCCLHISMESVDASICCDQSRLDDDIFTAEMSIT